MNDQVSGHTLTEAETSRYIRMSRSWLAQARMRGSVDAPPHLKIARSVRYLRTDLDLWLEERRWGSAHDKKGKNQ